MVTEDTLEQNKAFIRNHFEAFMNRQKVAIAYQNFGLTFWIMMNPMVNPSILNQRNR